MENFDIAKYLKENHLGPHSILGGYVDLHALKEESQLNEASLELDWASGMPALKAKCKKYGLTCKVVKEFGPGGGNPLVKIIGSKDNIISFLKDGYADADQLEDFVADIKENLEEEVGNNSIDQATLSAIDSWVKKNYPTARIPNPAEVEDVEYYLGTDYIKLYKVEPNDPQQDEDDEYTTIAFINVTVEDGNIVYFEVRGDIKYPGDYEQGEGNYGEPNGVWNSKTKEFIYDGYSSDDEDAEEFMEAEDLEGWKMVKKLAANDKRVAAAFLKPLVTVYGEDNVKIVKQGEVYKIYTKGKEELNNEADYGNNQPVDEVPYGDGEGRLDGFGDEFDQVNPVEEMDNSMTGDKGWQYDDDEDNMDPDTRFADLGGDQIKASIKSLMDDGFDTREIAQFVVDTIRAFKSFKEEVTVSSSGIQMESDMYTVDFGTNTQDFELDRDRNVLIGLKPQMGLPGSSPRQQDIIPVMIDANGFLYTKDPRVKDISPASNASPFSRPGYMNRD